MSFLQIRGLDARLKGNGFPILRNVSISVAAGKVHGLVGGYYDFDKWWEYMLKLEFLIATGDWSCPALYQAARELADGYPDPRTGDCTAISSAFRMDALPAFVVHESAATPVRASR